jgi:hypothetical protein
MGWLGEADDRRRGQALDAKGRARIERRVLGLIP